MAIDTGGRCDLSEPLSLPSRRSFLRIWNCYIALDMTGMLDPRRASHLHFQSPPIRYDPPKSGTVLVAMMDVRIMWMRMSQRFVDVPVRVRLRRVYPGFMCMLMMF